MGDREKVKRRLKTVIARKPVDKYEIDSDFNLARIEMLAQRALVGRLEFTSGTKLEIYDQVSKYWVPLMGMAPRINLLMNKWPLFIFPEDFDIEQMLSMFWVFK